MIFSWLSKIIPHHRLPVRDGISPATVQDMLRAQRQLLGASDTTPMIGTVWVEIVLLAPDKSEVISTVEKIRVTHGSDGRTTLTTPEPIHISAVPAPVTHFAMRFEPDMLTTPVRLERTAWAGDHVAIVVESI